MCVWGKGERNKVWGQGGIINEIVEIHRLQFAFSLRQMVGVQDDDLLVNYCLSQP